MTSLTGIAQANGIIPALLTPYNSDGSVNLSELARVVEHLLEQGVHGFYVGGSTGDGVLQSFDERIASVRTVADVTAGSVPVIAHIGTLGTAETIRLSNAATANGATAVSAITPSIPLRLTEVAGYFRDVARASDAPFVAYNFPGRTGVSLSLDFFAELADEPNIAGVKYTSIDTFQLGLLARFDGGRYPVWNGNDEVISAGLTAGAHGAIGSTFNVVPALYLSILEAFRSGDQEQVVKLQARIGDFVAELVKTDVFAALREFLNCQGFDMGEPRRPLRRLNSVDKAQVARLAASV